ncbi:atp3 gamma subunit of the F1 sector of mitochondrial F1F0 ATP synthase [Hanseniaspora valbyensis]
MFRQAAIIAVKQSYPANVRQFATLREIEMRLKSIKNIKKITKTMMIVASTRLSKAERTKVTTSEFSKPERSFYEITEAEKSPLAKDGKSLIIAITSDKGLCGSIHSSMAKKIRLLLKEDTTADIITIGDKIKQQVQRTHPENVKLGFNGVGKVDPNFLETSLISAEILKYINESPETYNKISVYFNDPVTSISFEASNDPVYSEATVGEAPGLCKYEITQDLNIPKDLFEYALNTKILAAMGKGYAAEISARRNAMDNASKNAGDMINKYSILYNRTRQAVITNELVDIITGASSLD